MIFILGSSEEKKKTKRLIFVLLSDLVSELTCSAEKASIHHGIMECLITRSTALTNPNAH